MLVSGDPQKVQGKVDNVFMVFILNGLYGLWMFGTGSGISSGRRVSNASEPALGGGGQQLETAVVPIRRLSCMTSGQFFHDFVYSNPFLAEYSSIMVRNIRP